MFTLSPFSLMRRFTEEMDRAFSSFGGRSSGRESNWLPPVEVRQSESNLIVCAELPGLSDKDVHVEIDENSLVIEGQRRFEHTGKDEGVQHSELTYGQFYRRIPLPQDAQTEQAKAEFKNGILEVTIPVPQAQQKRRQIPVTTASGAPSTARAQTASERT